MKRTILMLVIFVFCGVIYVRGATRNICPNGDGEGSIGTSSNRWGDLWCARISGTQFSFGTGGVTIINIDSNSVLNWNSSYVFVNGYSNIIKTINSSTSLWNSVIIASNNSYWASNQLATNTLSLAATNPLQVELTFLNLNVVTNGGNTTRRLTFNSTNYLISGESSVAFSASTNMNIWTADGINYFACILPTNNFLPYAGTNALQDKITTLNSATQDIQAVQTSLLATNALIPGIVTTQAQNTAVSTWASNGVAALNAGTNAYVKITGQTGTVDLTSGTIFINSIKFNTNTITQFTGTLDGTNGVGWTIGATNWWLLFSN